MSARDRTVPIHRPAFADAAPTPPHRFRLVIDLGIVLTIIGFIFSSGVAWDQFQADGKRLDYHDQEIHELTQLQQQQQQTLAALSQNVSDIKDSVTEAHR